MLFEWDETKNTINRQKHGLSFETASLIFEDSEILSVMDMRFAYYEERWRSIGQVNGIVLYVAHEWREEKNEEIIRIISARKASSSEEWRYFSHRKGALRIECLTE